MASLFARRSVKFKSDPRERETQASRRARLVDLELIVSRRLDGALAGDYRGLLPGPGSEPGEAREYQPGDDVRAIDWSVTARTTIPHVRNRIADRELEIWLCLDASPRLIAGSTDQDKRDLALAAVAALGFLASRSGLRVGLIVSSHKQMTPTVVSPKMGKDHARRLLAIADQALYPLNSESSAKGTSNRIAVNSTASSSTATSVSTIIDTARSVIRRRGLVVVITDFLDDVDWTNQARRLAVRTEILAVHLADPLDIRVPAVGRALLADPASGDTMEVAITEYVAAAYAETARAHREEVHGVLRSCNAPVLALRTDRDWVRDISRFVALRRKGALPSGSDLVRDIDFPEGEKQ